MPQLGVFFRSPLVAKLYRKLVLSNRRWQRCLGLSLLAVLYLLRTLNQFSSGRIKAATLLALTATQAAALTAPLQLVVAAAGATFVLVAAGLVLLACSQADDGIGHRGGAVGFKGPLCENTIEAAVSLLERDQVEGPLPHFPYLEFDVQETADGELVVFHDPLLSAAFPSKGDNSAIMEQLEEATGVPLQLLTVQDLTLAQLQSLHLAGRAGLHVPTLQQYISACVSAGLRRTLAVEVKTLRTDKARQRLIDIISDYLETQGPLLDADPVAAQHRCPQLGWAGIIAFPHFFANSFGEFGTPEWRRWADEFKRRQIPVRACHALWLTLIG